MCGNIAELTSAIFNYNVTHCVRVLIANSYNVVIGTYTAGLGVHHVCVYMFRFTLIRLFGCLATVVVASTLLMTIVT